MRIAKEFILREIAGECILVPTGATTQEFNGMLTMSETARFIWENLEKADSLEEMIQMILDEYEIDEETARRDAVGFISQLVGNGFVECTKEDRTW
ncbi:MAG: PqqD family protein [Eubacteriales bacterium]|nr:PqqD family protein [Eubacteriales bacterium]